MIPDWLSPFFLFFPAYAWFFLGLGLPWALALLPRDEWNNRPTVLGVGLALGPLLGTAWLFILGTWSSFRLDYVLTGMLSISLIGITAAWLRRYTWYRERYNRPEKWHRLDFILLALIAIAFLIHIWITLFWPFVQYDTLWTFGYNPRIFMLEGNIPDWLSYYPQLVPLTYTYGYLVNGGEINDYVAKAAVPWYILASIVMAFLLGKRVYGKRSIGILTAALWMLIPSALYWSGSGDLEHPIAVYFTGAVIFFILAWRSHSARHAILSGIMFSGALWTKPTGGAFALGVMLLVGLSALRLILPNRTREQLGVPARAGERRGQFGRKFRVAALTGLASLPLGALWYVRNWALGHEVITFPDEYWHDLAQRSGQEFGWLIVILGLAVGFVGSSIWPSVRANGVGMRTRFAALMIGFGLVLLGTLPSALVLQNPWTASSAYEWMIGARTQPQSLSLPEIILILIGLGLTLWALWPAWMKTTERARSSAMLSVLLIAPFTLVWFFNFSYHYRLVLTITPVLAALAAALIDAWLLPFMAQNRFRQTSFSLLAVLLAIPAYVVAGHLTFEAQFIDRLATVEEKYAAANPALMDVVDFIAETNAQQPWREGQLYIVTLDEKRLNFFFPKMHSIWRDWMPTQVDELYNPTDYIIGSDHADFLWDYRGQFPNQISAQMNIGFVYSNPFLEYGAGSIMGTLLTPHLYTDDGTHRFIVYHVYPPHRNYSLEEINPPFQFAGDQWGFLGLRGLEFRAALEGDSVPLNQDEDGRVILPKDAPIFIQLYWQRPHPDPIERDYHIFIHLIDPQTGEILAGRDGPMIDGLLPLSLMLYPDLTADRRLWNLPSDLPLGAVDLHIGLYDPLHPELARLPVIEGDFSGEDGVFLRGALIVEDGGFDVEP